MRGIGREYAVPVHTQKYRDVIIIVVLQTRPVTEILVRQNFGLGVQNLVPRTGGPYWKKGMTHTHQVGWLFRQLGQQIRSQKLEDFCADKHLGFIIRLSDAGVDGAAIMTTGSYSYLKFVFQHYKR